jgi:hypothetical protein
MQTALLYAHLVMDAILFDHDSGSAHAGIAAHASAQHANGRDLAALSHRIRLDNKLCWSPALSSRLQRAFSSQKISVKCSSLQQW